MVTSVIKKTSISTVTGLNTSSPKDKAIQMILLVNAVAMVTSVVER